jgi:fatty acid desaturase
LWRLGGQGYWWRKGGALLRTALGARIDTFVPDAARPAVVREARLYLLAYALVAALSVAFGSWLAVMLWLGPMAATAPFHPYYALAEHHGLPNSPNILESTRTTLTNPVMRWLSWNMGYHTAHHLFPGVPFHALAALHRELDIPLVGHGYLGFHRGMIRDLRGR